MLNDRLVFCSEKKLEGLQDVWKAVNRTSDVTDSLSRLWSSMQLTHCDVTNSETLSPFHINNIYKFTDSVFLMKKKEVMSF